MIGVIPDWRQRNIRRLGLERLSAVVPALSCESGPREDNCARWDASKEDERGLGSRPEDMMRIGYVWRPLGRGSLFGILDAPFFFSPWHDAAEGSVSISTWV